MISKLKQFFRYILRKLLFKDSCVICEKILKVEEKAFCKKCLENLKSTSSLKKYKNIYYLWTLDENFLKILEASKNRLTIVEELEGTINEKVLFILKNERISTLSYKSSEFFSALFNKEILRKFSEYINLENENKLIFKDHINQNASNKDIYFSLFINALLIQKIKD